MDEGVVGLGKDEMLCSRCGARNPPDVSVCQACQEPLGGPDVAEPETIEAPRQVLFSRYELVRELGKGGMGVVYQVLDREIGEEVALKVIAPERATDEGLLARFRNEVKLARKIAHRNVCRVFDLGEEDGTYYLTMEYIQGRELSKILRGRGRLATERLLSIAEGVCRGLAEAHRLGVVHRDLKPQNIMIDRDDQPHILDFGIAHSLATAGITGDGSMIGTPHYMSPEQVLGREVDARSDIYSLGATLYRMALGQPPFEGDSAITVAMKHRAEPVPDPRTLDPDLPDRLTYVITRCLAKSPSDRFQDVAEVLAMLRGGAAPAPPTAASISSELAAILDEEAEEVAAEVVFVSRDRELAQLEEGLASALASRGRVLFVSGEPGSGKTTLAAEFAARTLEREEAVVVAAGRCDALTGAGDPYHPFRQILELLTGDIQTTTQVGVLRRSHGRALWELAPDAIAALVEQGPELIETLIPAGPLQSRARECVQGQPEWLSRLVSMMPGEAAPQGAKLREDQLVDRYGRVLLTLAARRPLVLVLDDLHWLDSGSAGLLLHLGRRIAGAPVLIVGTYRSAEIPIGRNGDRHPLEPVLNELRRDLGEIEIKLDQAEGRRFLDAYVDTQPNRFGDRFRDALFERTQGHALFTIELLRSMRERGMVVQDDEGFWLESETLDWSVLPERTEGVVRERIDSVPGEARELLDLASVEGEEFTAEVIAAIRETPPRVTVKMLSSELDKRYRLVKAQGVRRIDGKRVSIYRFRHALFQKYLYEQLDEVERSYLHEEVASTLESLHGDRPEEIAVQLAEHYELASDPEKASHYRALAGEASVSLSAFTEANSHLFKGLSLLESLPESVGRRQRELQLRSLLAGGLVATEGFGSDSSVANFNRMHELSDELGDDQLKGVVLSLLYGVHFILGNLEKRTELGQRARELAEKTGDPVQGAVAGSMQGTIAFYEGRFAEAVKLLSAPAEVFEIGGHAGRMMAYGSDPLLAGRNMWCWALQIRGEADRGWSEYEKTLEQVEQLEDTYALAETLCIGCAIGWEAGRDLEELERLAGRSLEICQEHGFPFYLVYSLSWRGLVSILRSGEPDGFADIYQSLELKDGLVSPKMPGHGSHYLQVVVACKLLGRTVEGLEALATARRISEETGDHYYEAEMLRHEGDLLAQSGGDPRAVERCYRAAIELAGRQGARLFELRASVGLGRLLLEGGRGDEVPGLVEPILASYPGKSGRDLRDARKLLADAAGGA